MCSSVRDFGRAAWSEVYNRIIGAVVFLDDASSECLHWDSDLFNLLTGGAAGVKTLSPFECCAVDKKAVFITQATSTQLRTVREIIQNSDFTHCILVSTVSLDVVYLEMNEGRNVSDVVTAGKAPAEANKQLEALLLEWMNKKQSAAEVIHIPICTIAPTDVVFLTPPYSSVYPLYSGNLIPDTPSVDLYTLTSEERSMARRLASSLNSMFDSMNLKEEVYYMGTYSSLVAGVLENSPYYLARRKNCSNPASLILVDRTLDLCGATSHSMESLLDKIMSVLPKFPGHSTDVAVDMSPLCEANVITLCDDMQLSPGCLHHEVESCAQTYEHMINKSQKEVMVELYDKLSKVDVQRSPGPKSLVKVTPQSVEKIVLASKGKYDIIEQHLGLLQQALAVVHTLKSPAHAHIELLSNIERQVLQNVATSGDSTSVLTQMSHLIKTRRDRNVPLERLLALLVHVYSLTGNEISFSKQHEEALTETLSVAIFEDHKSLFSSPVDGAHIVTPEHCDEMSKKVMARLKDIGQMRRILHKYASVVKGTEPGVGHEYRGLLLQLVSDLVDSERPELGDLTHRHEGIKDLLRSSLSILSSKKTRTTKHPIDNPTVVLFVIGGVTAEECSRIHRAVITSGVDSTVLIGSTKFVTPTDAARDALAL